MRAVGNASERDETHVGERKGRAPVIESMIERVVERENLRQALRQVKRNQGSAGIDGMSVSELPEYLKRHWPRLRAELLDGRYAPQPVRRVSIPKSGGGKRELGIPTVLDRHESAKVVYCPRRFSRPRQSSSKN